MKKTIASISKLQSIACKDNGESLIKFGPEIKTDYRRADTDLQEVLVRESVLTKLKKVQARLKEYDPNLELLVVEGFRSLKDQETYYLQTLLQQFTLDPSLDFSLLLEKTHQFIALPSVAGHPTGGAVDVTLLYSGKEIDMGGAIADFSVPHLLPTDSPFLTFDQTRYRKILHDFMMAEDFAPFYGEWWHFSYGDREWAVFYEKQEAIYSPLAR